MKIKKDFLLKTVAGQKVVVPTGDNVVNINAAITLNETAAFLWEQLQNECSKEELLTRMTETYDVSKETAEKDIDVFLNVLKEQNILE